MATNVRVGVDLASTEAVRASIERFGDRYLGRCFTEHELATSSGGHQSRASSLAARFAAKEATYKALAAGRQAVDWRSIEICRSSDGTCGVRLHGAMAELASRQGITELSVSLTHEADMAAAIVVALCDAPLERVAERVETKADASASEGRPAMNQETIRQVLREHARLPVDVSALADEDDLFLAGMTSHASVNVMLALEDAFDVEFPEAMLSKATFESISAIASALTELTGSGVVR